MKKSIPNEVKRIADREACNSINYLGNLDGVEVYSLGEVDENGDPIPNGLPFLALWDGERVETVCGEESLDLLSRLD